MTACVTVELFSMGSVRSFSDRDLYPHISAIGADAEYIFQLVTKN